jgi:8-oxoguanine DNA glycosylase, N-terminal domain
MRCILFSLIERETQRPRLLSNGTLQFPQYPVIPSFIFPFCINKQLHQAAVHSVIYASVILFFLLFMAHFVKNLPSLTQLNQTLCTPFTTYENQLVQLPVSSQELHLEHCLLGGQAFHWQQVAMSSW